VRPDSKSTVERAFELARTGSYRSIEDLVKGLNREGFLDPVGQLSGNSIRKQLRALMKAAHTISEGAAE
jgi:hypothetical protein